MKQQRDALLKEKETAEKVAARAFAQSYLSDLVPSVFSTLSQNGFFYDPVERGMLQHPGFGIMCCYAHVPRPHRGGVHFHALATAGS